jgi:hypothetical protein
MAAPTGHGNCKASSIRKKLIREKRKGKKNPPERVYMAAPPGHGKHSFFNRKKEKSERRKKGKKNPPKRVYMAAPPGHGKYIASSIRKTEIRKKGKGKKKAPTREGVHGLPRQLLVDSEAAQVRPVLVLLGMGVALCHVLQAGRHGFQSVKIKISNWLGGSILPCTA